MKKTLALALATTTALSTGAFAQDITEFRIGILGGENAQDRMNSYQCLADYTTEALGVETKLFAPADYNGVIQGLLGGTLDMAWLGASAYAATFLQDPEAVEPVLIKVNLDGSVGYHSIGFARVDSGIKSLEDMKGKVFGFGDPNSTSGYLVPSYELKTQGYDPKTFFEKTGFGGGHEQAVVAVLNKQYDAGVTWTSGVGEKSEGFSRGNLRKMVDKGALNMDDIRIIWKSNLITNGPVVVRKDVPQELKDLVRGILVSLPVQDPDCAKAVAGGEMNGFQAIGHDFYLPIIEMRRELLKARRG